MSSQTLDISWETIIKVFIAGFTLYLLFLARNFVLWFFFALIISLLVDPAVNFLRWLKVPKIIAVILIYLSIFGILGFIIYLVSPIFLFELKNLSQNIPDYITKISPFLQQFGVNTERDFESIIGPLILNLQESSISIFKAFAAFFGGIFSAFFIFTLAFFISLEEKGAERVLVLLTPKKYEGYIIALFERAQAKVSGWFGARVLSCLFVGISIFIILYILQVKYAFILALVSGVMNFVPYIGPAISLILAVLFSGVSNSWLIALYVFLAILLVQEIENNLLSPLLMKKFMDLPPVLVLASLIVGGEIFGFLGAIFSVPVFGIVYEFLKEFLEKRREEESQSA